MKYGSEMCFITVKIFNDLINVKICIKGMTKLQKLYPARTFGFKFIFTKYVLDFYIITIR